MKKIGEGKSYVILQTVNPDDAEMSVICDVASAMIADGYQPLGPLQQYGESLCQVMWKPPVKWKIRKSI